VDWVSLILSSSLVPSLFSSGRAIRWCKYSDIANRNDPSSFSPLSSGWAVSCAWSTSFYLLHLPLSVTVSDSRRKLRPLSFLRRNNRETPSPVMAIGRWEVDLFFPFPPPLGKVMVDWLSLFLCLRKRHGDSSLGTREVEFG